MGNSLLSNDVNSFLGGLHALRQQKGQYLTLSFCDQLENVSHKIATIIAKEKLTSQVQTIVPLKQQASEKMSDSMVDLCLECCEMYLQEIPCCVDAKSSVQLSLPALSILTNVANDLSALSSYIRFTLTAFPRPSKTQHSTSTNRAS